MAEEITTNEIVELLRQGARFYRVFQRGHEIADALARADGHVNDLEFRRGKLEQDLAALSAAKQEAEHDAERADQDARDQMQECQRRVEAARVEVDRRIEECHAAVAEWDTAKAAATQDHERHMNHLRQEAAETRQAIEAQHRVDLATVAAELDAAEATLKEIRSQIAQAGRNVAELIKR